MRKVRIGILGGGGILGAHAPGYAAIADRCEVVAVAEPDNARHARVRQLLGDRVALHPDYHDVLARPDVDAVDIILPHHLHLPATLAAAEARKPVLTEKVMARNIHECDQMIAACEEAGISLTVCHDRRYHGEWMALKDVLNFGALGEPFYWKLEHNQNVLFPEGAWARSRDGIGGGAVMSCLTHQIDALRWYGGEVARVTCLSKVLPERMEGESASVIAAEMQSGALVNLSINWFTRSHASANGLWYELVQVCGTRGEAYYISGKGTWVLLHDDTNAAAIERYGREALQGFVSVPSGDWVGHVRCIEEWVKHLRGEPAHILTSGRDVRGTVEVAEAAYRSAETGRTVSLPIEPVPWQSTSGEAIGVASITGPGDPGYVVAAGGGKTK